LVINIATPREHWLPGRATEVISDDYMNNSSRHGEEREVKRPIHKLSNSLPQLDRQFINCIIMLSLLLFIMACV